MSHVYEIIYINDTWSGINIFPLCLPYLFNLEVPTSLYSFQPCNINIDTERHDDISASCFNLRNCSKIVQTFFILLLLWLYMAANKECQGQYNLVAFREKYLPQTKKIHC